MLHCDGTDASTTFTDSSTTPHTVTANGNAQVDTSQSQFGGASGLFDGTGDYLSIPETTDFDFGTGDFTIDFWLRFNTGSTSLARDLFELGLYSQNKGVAAQWNGFSILVYFNGGTEIFTGAWAPTENTWYHLAMARSGTNFRVFIDGTQLGSTVTNSTDITTVGQGNTIGRFAQAAFDFYGLFF